MAKISINLKDGSVEQESAEQPLIIGIDLGTTNSLVAYIQDGQPITLRKEGGSSSLVPSIIHFGADGQIIIGEAARAKMITHPDRTIYSAKRLMGKSYGDLSTISDRLGYKIIDTDEEELVKVEVDGVYYSPVMLSAEILKELKTIAETQLRQEVSKAVITVPAYFNDAQRQATRDAGKIAGLDVLRIVNEPTAASLAYDIGTTKEDDQKIVVYDLGGGTFDISILDIQDGVFEVLATNGDTFLGGDDFDQAIMDTWLHSGQIQEIHLGDKSNLQSIRVAAEDAKITLSGEDFYKNTVAGLQLEITKAQFENAIAPLVNKTLELCKRCIQDAEIEISEVDEVIMVGGSTRTPLVKQMVSEFFKKEVNDHLDPDEVVALGAAVQADILSGNRKDMLLLDITPLSLGIETVGGLMDTIIARNSKVPNKAGRQYTTSVDGQTKLKVAVYQGERDLVSDNRKLGEFVLTGIPPMAAGMPKIDIQFILDADGILRVKAAELRSGVETQIEIKSQYGISEEEMAQMLIDSLKNAQGDMDQRALIEARNEASNVILHSNKFVEQNAQILSPDEILQLVKYKTLLEQEVKSGTKDSINQAMETLNTYSRPIAERAMDANIAKALKDQQV